MPEHFGDNISMADIRRIEERLGHMESKMDEMNLSLYPIRELVGPLKSMLEWWQREQVHQQNNAEWRKTKDAEVRELTEALREVRAHLRLMKWVVSIVSPTALGGFLLSAFRDHLLGK